jgi:ankyrin repeat protein
VCANDPLRLPFAYSADAFRESKSPFADAHAAVATGNAEFVALALELGAPLEQRDWRRRTPLLAALAEAGNRDAARAQRGRQMAAVLLAHGADTRARDAAGCSALRLALAAGVAGDDWLARVPARELAADRDALGATLLHAAAAFGRVESARALVDRGVPVKALTADGRTAMHFAHGAEMVAYLDSLGLAADAADQRGRTPLHYAVMGQDLETAQALRGRQRDAAPRDLFGMVALDYLPRQQARWRELLR